MVVGWERRKVSIEIVSLVSVLKAGVDGIVDRVDVPLAKLSCNNSLVVWVRLELQLADRLRWS